MATSKTKRSAPGPDDRDAIIDALTHKLHDADEEIEALREERDELREERDGLRERVSLMEQAAANRAKRR